MNKFVKLIKRYSSVIQIPLGVITTLFLTYYGDILINTHDNKFIYLLIGLIFLIFQIILAVFPRISFKKHKKEIINDLLNSCRKLLFMNCCNDDWEICGMIQVPHTDGTRRTPYYTNSAVNPAIRNHFKLDFGDVGKAFFKGEIRKQCFTKKLTKSSWNNSPADYKECVPKELRAIIAAAIFSPYESDSSKIIGVLEFDIFNGNNKNEISRELFNSIASNNNKNALCEWANSLAILMEEI